MIVPFDEDIVTKIYDVRMDVPSKPKKIWMTAVCMLALPDYPDPLIYSFKAYPEETMEQLFERCVKTRKAETGETKKSIREKLRICMVFKGDLNPTHDWRF